MLINEPLISSPVFSTKVWGSRELNQIFNYKSDEPLGEIWLFSGYAGQETNLIGINSNKNYGTVSEVFKTRFNKFPLLLKLIAASEWLSVQLHPDNKLAQEIESQEFGKNESWLFLKDKGKVKVSNDNEKVIKALDNNDWESVLKNYEMKKFDIMYIPAGTVHTLGPDSLMLEIQQSSNLTYRLYDWGRPREIHIEKAKRVMERVHSSYSISLNSNGLITDYFSFEKMENITVNQEGIYVNLKNFQTIYLPENVEFYLDGEYVKFWL